MPWMRAREMWIHAVDLDVGRVVRRHAGPDAGRVAHRRSAAMGGKPDCPALRSTAIAAGRSARARPRRRPSPARRPSSPHGCWAAEGQAAARRRRPQAADAAAMALTTGFRDGLARLRRRPGRVRAAHRLPGGGAGRGGRGRRARGAGRPARVDATDIQLVTIDPPGARTSTRRSASPGAATGSGCTTRSPTSARSSRRAARSTPRCASAARPSTCPTATCRCTRPCSPRARRACCRTARAGRAVDDRPRRGGRAHGRRRAPGPVRSRAQLDYAGVQADIDAGRPHPAVAALPELGALRRELAVAAARSSWSCPSRRSRPTAGRLDRSGPAAADVDAWNAEISLLTGMAAAAMMLDAGVGVLRTLPAPEPTAVVAAAAPARDARHRLAGRRHGGARCCPGLPARPGPALALRRTATGCCAARATRRSTGGAGRPRTPGTAASARRTRTSPRRCGGWSTGSARRSASPSPPGAACRTGCAPRCRAAGA